MLEALNVSAINKLIDNINIGVDWLRKLKEERDAWEQTAMEAYRNRDYYHGLVTKIGEMFGGAAYIQEDGGRVIDVLCAKVPKLVEEALEELYMLRADKQLSS